MADYRYAAQADDNALALYDAEYATRLKLLDNIVREFNNHNLTWGVGCSFNLFIRGLVDDFHDFDILVANQDVETAKAIMKEMGASLVATGSNGSCNSDDYSHWQIDNCDVDLIAGFRVETFGESFYCRITADIVEMSDCAYLPFVLPIIKLEPLYILYCMMEGWQHKRKYKRMLIEEFFKHESLDKVLLKQYLTNSTGYSTVAPWITNRVKELGWV